MAKKNSDGLEGGKLVSIADYNRVSQVKRKKATKDKIAKAAAKSKLDAE